MNVSANKNETGVRATFGNIRDPESGIGRIEYKIEVASYSRNRMSPFRQIKRWTSNGNNTVLTFLNSTYSLNSGDTIRMSVRTVNNDGIVSSVTSRTLTLD